MGAQPLRKNLSPVRRIRPSARSDRQSARTLSHGPAHMPTRTPAEKRGPSSLARPQAVSGIAGGPVRNITNTLLTSLIEDLKHNATCDPHSLPPPPPPEH
eukprot:5978388-Prymnesium_polylepis.1